MKRQRPTLEQIEHEMENLAAPQTRIIAEENTTRIAAVGYGACDFCSTALTTTSTKFEARNVLIDDSNDIAHISEGPWGACHPCALLVSSNDHNALLDRSVAMHPILWGVKPIAANLAEMRESLALAHNAFWRSKT